MTQDLPPLPLPAGIRSRMVPGINGLTMHVLEAGFETPGRPAVLLLHGFPELAFSWRKVMGPLAAAGYHVIAPDQRGYGRTTGWDADYDGDLRAFSLLNLVRDALGLVSAFGLRSVTAVVGHDFGASVAAWCALVRPDVFRAVDADERAVRRAAADSVRYGQHARRCEGAGSCSCGPRGAGAAAQTLPVVLFDARSQRRHAELSAGRARLPARLLSPQERRLAGQQAVSARRLDRG